MRKVWKEGTAINQAFTTPWNSSKVRNCAKLGLFRKQDPVQKIRPHQVSFILGANYVKETSISQNSPPNHAQFLLFTQVYIPSKFLSILIQRMFLHSMFSESTKSSGSVGSCHICSK